jgi:hypothetical protein
MHGKFRQITAGLILATLVLGACNMPRKDATPTQSAAGAIYTAAAETIAAQLTGVSAPPVTAQSTRTPDGEAATRTPQPSDTPQATAQPATSTSVASATPLPCDQAKFLKDITIPDNTEMDPGESFVKTWQLQNNGSCTWTTAYALVFSGGEAMGAPAAVQLPSNVAPGDTINLSVTLKAPEDGGTFRGDFKLRNASNALFGLGKDNKPFWVQIKVAVETGLLFDFLVKAGSADWVSSIGGGAGNDLEFGGPEDDPNGVVKIVDAVKLETGATSGKVLLMFPRHDNNGAVSGLFPAYTVQNGDHLKARLGFMLPSGESDCGSGKVKFQITYKEEGGSLKLLKEWTKSCNGSLLPIDIDLSDLKGKSVQFAFVVVAEGAFTDDWAIWNSPRIEH